MTPDVTLNRLRQARIIPIIRAKDAVASDCAARALLAAGFHTVEIALTSHDVVDAIGKLATHHEPLIGAGTVLSTEEAGRAIDAGAAYVVSPCEVDGLVAYCLARQTACVPGAMTPSEILAQRRSGATAVKFFPANAAGGPGFVRAVKAVFPDIPLVPTGGIRCQDVEDYLVAGALAVGMGSELLPAGLVARGSHEEIQRVARDIIETWSERWNFTPKEETPNA